jgi:hypothetical protein
MRIELHPNDNALEGRPAVWIFQGKSVVLPVCGAAAFVGLFRIFAACGVDWPVDIGISVSHAVRDCWLRAPFRQRQVVDLCTFATGSG